MGPRLLVDGYNVVHAWDDLKTLMSASLEQARSDRFHADMLRGMGAGVIDALELRRRVEDAEGEMTRRLRTYEAT